MPTHTQYHTVKEQLKAFKDKGFYVRMDLQPMEADAAPMILVTNYIKSWRFCDPDWEVAIAQLATLYKNAVQAAHSIR
jgi:hypothetical protein